MSPLSQLVITFGAMSAQIPEQAERGQKLFARESARTATDSKAVGRQWRPT
jgi:hypothetical protein